MQFVVFFLRFIFCITCAKWLFSCQLLLVAYSWASLEYFVFIIERHSNVLVFFIYFFLWWKQNSLFIWNNNKKKSNRIRYGNWHFAPCTAIESGFCRWKNAIDRISIDDGAENRLSTSIECHRSTVLSQFVPIKRI